MTSSAPTTMSSTSERLFAEIVRLTSDSATRVGSPAARATATASTAHARTWSAASTSALPMIVRRPSKHRAEAQLLRRQRVECVLEPAHPRKVGHERGDPQVGAGLGSRSRAGGPSSRAPALRLPGRAPARGRGRPASPGSRPGRGPRSRAVPGGRRIPGRLPGHPRGDLRPGAAGRRRPARVATWHAASTAAPTAAVPVGGAEPVPGGGRPPVERAGGVPCGREPVVHVARVAEPACGLGEQRVVEAHAARRHLGEDALAHCGIEPFAGFGRGAGVGEGEHREGRARAGDRGGRQQRSSVGV